MTYHSNDPLTIARILAFVKPELRAARSDADLRHRLANIGYGIRDTVRGRMLTTLPHGLELMPLPALPAQRP